MYKWEYWLLPVNTQEPSAVKAGLMPSYPFGFWLATIMKRTELNAGISRLTLHGNALYFVRQDLIHKDQRLMWLWL